MKLISLYSFSISRPIWLPKNEINGSLKVTKPRLLWQIALSILSHEPIVPYKEVFRSPDWAEACCALGRGRLHFLECRQKAPMCGEKADCTVNSQHQSYTRWKLSVIIVIIIQWINSKLWNVQFECYPLTDLATLKEQGYILSVYSSL